MKDRESVTTNGRAVFYASCWPDLKDEGVKFTSYLSFIMKNLFINQWRRKKKAQEAIVILDKSYEQQIDHDEEIIDRLIDKLAPNYKIVLRLLADDYTYEEIAEKTGHPVGTVKSHIHKGRQLLEKLLINNRIVHGTQISKRRSSI